MKSILKTKMLRTAAIVLCSACLVVSAAKAQQDAPPPPPDGQQQGPPAGAPMQMNLEHRVEMMQRHLNLTPEQTAQVRTALADNMAKMEALRMNGSLAPQDRHAQMKQIRMDVQTKIRGMLTPEQQAKFDAMQAKMQEKEKERRSEEHNGAGAPTPPAPTNTTSQR